MPREATKADRSHEVPLSPLLIEVLTALPRAGEYVFTSTRGERPIGAFRSGMTIAYLNTDVAPIVERFCLIGPEASSARLC